MCVADIRGGLYGLCKDRRKIRKDKGLLLTLYPCKYDQFQKFSDSSNTFGVEISKIWYKNIRIAEEIPNKSRLPADLKCDEDQKAIEK